MSKFIVIKTYIVEADDMEEAKEISKTVKDHKILEIYKEEDGTEY